MYFHVCSFSFFRSSFRVPGTGGEGRRPELARGIGLSRGAVYRPALPSPSLFPECRAHPGAEGEGERHGEGVRLLILSSKAENRPWRFKNVKQQTSQKNLLNVCSGQNHCLLCAFTVVISQIRSKINPGEQRKSKTSTNQPNNVIIKKTLCHFMHVLIHVCVLHTTEDFS